MPAIPSVMARVAANDRLQRLKEISIRIYNACCQYKFYVLGGGSFWHDTWQYNVAKTYDHAKYWEACHWMHRQVHCDAAWHEMYDVYIKEHVI